jgi:hypothetical protein
MRIRLAIPDRHIDADILNAALEATTRANEKMHASGETPSVRTMIASGARWKPEPAGPEHFDLASTIASRGWGDCDDWAPSWAGELRATGRDPDARAVVRRSGPSRWHAVVERGNGRIDDPSRWAGMGRKASIHGAVVPLMAPPGGGVLAMRPWGAGWAGRCDLPWGNTAHSLSGLAFGETMLDAAQEALDGACYVGDASGAVDPVMVARAMGVDAALCGHSADEIQQALLDRGIDGDDIVGSFFDTITSAVAPLAKMAIPIAASMVPGGSLLAPLATGLIDKFTGAPAAPGSPNAVPGGPPPAGGGGGYGGGGGTPGGGGTRYARGDGGPIIIRF